MEFRILGPVSAVSESRPLSIGGPKQRTVLAMLIANADKQLTADIIQAAVYGEHTPNGARRTIQTFVSSLRSVVGDAITRNGAGWSFVGERAEVDGFQFEDMYESARHLPPETAAVVLRAALAMWQGQPFADVEAHGLLDGEITRLNELRISAQQAGIDADLALGRDGDLIGEIETLLVEHPYQERFRGQHMLALYRSGRQGEALQSYKHLRDLLLDELGIDPAPELQVLERRILQQDASLLLGPQITISPPAAQEPLASLPVRATSLVGRHMELQRIRSMLADNRLVTLTGVGGSGKTRLGIAVAQMELSESKRGAFFVDLSLLSKPADVVLAVAEAIRLPLGGNDPMARVIDHLAVGQAMIVLDNCEHVIDACADFAAGVLERPGDWTILATSREPLDVEGEQQLHVRPLSVDGDCDALELFETRAQELDPDFVLDDTNRATVGQLCERLDGLPLAIELAAARTLVMSPVELLDRLKDGLSVLSVGRRRSQRRWRTLEATLDWSYDLLDADEQHLLMALSVFRGSFSPHGAAAVAEIDNEATIGLLESLIAKSLLTTAEDQGITTFRLLETVRAFAEEHLRRAGGLEATKDRHLEYQLRILGEPTQLEWPQLKPNLEAAIDRATSTGRYEDAVELFTATSPLWHEQTSLQSTLDRLDLVAAKLPPRSLLRERLTAPEMLLANGLRDETRLTAASTAAAESSIDDIRIFGLVFLANTLTLTDPQESLRLLAAAGEIRSPELQRAATKMRADLHMFAGEFREALELLRPYEGNEWEMMDATIATVLFLDGQRSEALHVADGHQEVNSSGSPGFRILRGICRLALGQRQAAESDLLAVARSAALGRKILGANDALIGLAALVNDDGDSQWAAELILRTGIHRWMTSAALARQVAEQIGVRDEFVRRQALAETEDNKDATGFLREALVQWDARETRTAKGSPQVTPPEVTG